MSGRPRTPIGTFGSISVTPSGRRYLAQTRYLDGRVRKVKATGPSAAAARRLLKERLLARPGYGNGGRLGPSSPFGELATMWYSYLPRGNLASSCV